MFDMISPLPSQKARKQAEVIHGFHQNNGNNI